jgi:hypothetical protein
VNAINTKVKWISKLPHPPKKEKKNTIFSVKKYKYFDPCSWV